MQYTSVSDGVREGPSLTLPALTDSVWRDAIARNATTAALKLGKLISEPACCRFRFPENQDDFRAQHAVEGAIDLRTQALGQNVFKLTVRLGNVTPFEPADGCTRDDALAWSFVSCHLLLGVSGGEFLSLLDPPAPWGEEAASCRNLGVFPVLVGDPSRRDTMLASPIILYDFPQIAAASPGDSFDATEIDEMLTLRIQTLTDQEKQEMSTLGPRAAQLLARCENLLPEQYLDLHGCWQREAGLLQPGMRVILRPRGNADAFDLALAGKTAVIVGIAQDVDQQSYVTVAVDDDPGRDLGLAGRPGHRFFFRTDEVEVLCEERQKRSRGVLVAGIGNVFFGDDAFGVEVVRRLPARSWPAGVVVKDMGIRGIDLAFALQEGFDTVILVDAVSRGSPPGTLHVLEIDADASGSAGFPEIHHLDLPQVFNLVRHMGGQVPRLLLVGCEPASLEPAADLSESAQHAITEAIAGVESLIAQWSATHEV